MKPDASRMRGEDRRELILVEATRVFGDHGYVGTTTAQVAEASGVSQPYVIRMFGTKEKLFLEVLDRALRLLLDAFREAQRDETSDDPLGRRLGRAYVGLLEHRGLLLSLMHAFVLGKDPVIGAAARTGFLAVYRFLTDDADFSAAEASEFISGGMMINTMVGLRMTDEYRTDADVRDLLDHVFPEKVDLLLGFAHATDTE
jgi:TetR/AcrR family transcriptional regulator